MNSTLNIASNLGTNPFELFKQDTDEVIMMINYFLILGAEAKSNNSLQSDRAILNDREESASFWACL